MTCSSLGGGESWRTRDRTPGEAAYILRVSNKERVRDGTNFTGEHRRRITRNPNTLKRDMYGGINKVKKGNNAVGPLPENDKQQGG